MAPPRRWLAVAVAVQIALAAGAAAVDPADAVPQPEGPLATATVRDLRTTETATGSLVRAETTTIVYGGRPAGGGMRLASEGAVTPTPSATPTPAPSPGPSPSQSPLPSPDPSPTPSPSPTPTARPSPSPTPPPPAGVPPSRPPAADAGPEARTGPRQGNPGPPGPPAGGEDTGGPSGGDLSGRLSDGASPEESPAATLTGVQPVGEIAGRGSVLYSADAEPVVSLLAPEALFRDLSTKESDGDDVKHLEENLATLGYGSGLKVDRTFDAATAAAVRRWESDLKRAEPDGVVSVGEVVFLEEPATVISHRSAVGEKLDSGTPVLVLGTESRVVKAMVDIDDRPSWGLGTVVQLGWDREPRTGTVTEVGRDEVGGQVQVTISLPQSPDLPTGTEVEAEVTTADRADVVSVPVSAIFEWSGGPAVRLAGKDRPVDVEVGIVSRGLAEITRGLEAGAKVVLPG